MQAATPTHRHFIIYKPHGMASQFVYNQKRKKALLGELHNFPEGTMAIGRLDVDSEGLLLLTTDGKESERLRSKNIEKEYVVQLDGIITTEAVAALEKGVEIGIKGEKYQTLPCTCKIINAPPDFPERGRKIRDPRHGPTSWLGITLTEGKNRQIRKMTAAVGFPTLRLLRVRIGHIALGHMQPRQVVEVASF
ncbi:pseudouridine synthase [bacterium]|nr:pseudouridine synthase [bacterium]